MQPDPSQPIEENLWWAIPGKLAGVRQPEAEELPKLQAAGIGAIVSVLEDSANISLYESVQIPHQWLPIEIDAAPSIEQLSLLENFIEQQQAEGRAVAIHCSGGKHRTGTAIAAYLIRQGDSYQQAMQTLLTANSGIELPDTQDDFLQQLAQEST
ncbi:MAG: dual specificity protein phosphatase family protein [Cyanobacteria bacterium P01_D01_bin.156]